MIVSANNSARHAFLFMMFPPLLLHKLQLLVRPFCQSIVVSAGNAHGAKLLCGHLFTDQNRVFQQGISAVIDGLIGEAQNPFLFHHLLVEECGIRLVKGPAQAQTPIIPSKEMTSESAFPTRAPRIHGTVCAGLRSWPKGHR